MIPLDVFTRKLLISKDMDIKLNINLSIDKNEY